MSARSASDPLRAAQTQLLQTVLLNTGDPQPVAIAPQHLYLSTVAHGSVEHEHARKARDAALENDLLVAYEARDGTTRYGLTEAGVAEIDDAELPIYDAADEGALRAVVETEAARPEPDKDVIGWANRHLSSLPDGESGGEADE